MAFMEEVPPQFFFPTVNDAVICSKWKVVGANKSVRSLKTVQESQEDDDGQ
jgi:hypothetical protein